MSTKPRTPQYFPRMKVRGARRRHIAPFHRLAGSFMRFGEGAVFSASAMRAFVKAVADDRSEQEDGK